MIQSTKIVEYFCDEVIPSVSAENPDPDVPALQVFTELCTSVGELKRYKENLTAIVNKIQVSSRLFHWFVCIILVIDGALWLGTLTRTISRQHNRGCSGKFTQAEVCCGGMPFMRITHAWKTAPRLLHWTGAVWSCENPQITVRTSACDTSFVSQLLCAVDCSISRAACKCICRWCLVESWMPQSPKQ